MDVPLKPILQQPSQTQGEKKDFSHQETKSKNESPKIAKIRLGLCIPGANEYHVEGVHDGKSRRIILVQNAPEKPALPPPSPYFHRDSRPHVLTQVVTVAEYNQPSSLTNTNSQNDMQLCYVFQNENKVKCCSSSASSVQKADVHVENLCDTPHGEENTSSNMSRNNILALDIECPSNSKKKYSLEGSLKTEIVRNYSCVFKSLPNLNTSSENLLL
ncbi:unnamed protein product [Callosobruchus maculatus]|uniref:Uncharacterized protein n=1 Tax=Callosobruchus maculatus TaxID=64391 RepID=A0A653DVK8_CALMS|nr:unnamed protein product [Callosobruchus maculatus]